jgi:type IV secretion system protein VirB2
VPNKVGDRGSLNADGYDLNYGGDKDAMRNGILIILLATLYSALSTTVALAQDLSTDPQGSGVVVNAMRWMQGTLLGTVATVAAVIAIASVGFLMLTGRINWRHGGVVILGCFILFGAASIVAGIQSAATFSGAG